MQMPPDANIPYEWQVGSEGQQLVIIVPSWSQVEKTSINYWSILEALQQLEREGEIEPSTWVLNDKGEE